MTAFIIRIALALVATFFNVYLFISGHWGWGIFFIFITALIILSFFRNENMILALNQMGVGNQDLPFFLKSSCSPDGLHFQKNAVPTPARQRPRSSCATSNHPGLHIDCARFSSANQSVNAGAQRQNNRVQCPYQFFARSIEAAILYRRPTNCVQMVVWRLDSFLRKNWPVEYQHPGATSDKATD